jgi:U2 small nuclear ribonucleoprotein B''
MTQSNHTLYVRNLNEKVSLRELKPAILNIFSLYGYVLDVKCWKNIRMRGQAFIIYQDPGGARRAIRALQGFPLFNKNIVIEYAKSKSDIISHLDGSYEEVMKERESRAKERREVFARFVRNATENMGKKKVSQRGPLSFPAPRKVPRIPDEMLPPNKILFVQNIKEEGGMNMLRGIFEQLGGFKELRPVPSKSTIAFVEFENEMFARMAKDQVDGRVVGDGHGWIVKVTFARQ